MADTDYRDHLHALLPRLTDEVLEPYEGEE